MALNLPNLQDRPRGGWPDKPPEKSRLAVKTEKRTDERKAEAAWKKAVWKRDGDHCRWCRRRVRRCLELVADRGECHHVCGRVVQTIRWDRRNGLLVCATCHERITGKVAEKHVVESKHVYTIDGVSYLNADKPVSFKRIA